MNKTILQLILILALMSVFISACKTNSLRYTHVYLDLDGTAVDTTNTIRPATIEAVKAFQARGGKVGIATGRTFEQARDAIEQLRPDLPVVLFNGGIIVDRKNHRFDILGNLDDQTMRTTLRLLAANQDIAGIVLHFPVASIPDRNTPQFAEQAKDFGVTFRYLDNLQSLSADSLIKIIILCPPDQTEHIYTAIKNSIPTTSRLVISSAVTIEVMPAQISKATALKRIAKQNGFSMEDVVAFGDSGNDVEMLSSVGLGIAMWNGRPQTRDAADIIIGPNYSDSIAKFLNSPIMK
ncbi:HAD family phosphatase [candidate division KSB1 bacterium]|nr:HAD family phosphatase [candidate division KSB1 bacterium]